VYHAQAIFRYSIMHLDQKMKQEKSKNYISKKGSRCVSSNTVLVIK